MAHSRARSHSVIRVDKSWNVDQAAEFVREPSDQVRTEPRAFAQAGFPQRVRRLLDRNSGKTGRPRENARRAVHHCLLPSIAELWSLYANQSDSPNSTGAKPTGVCARSKPGFYNNANALFHHRTQTTVCSFQCDIVARTCTRPAIRHAPARSRQSPRRVVRSGCVIPSAT